MIQATVRLAPLAFAALCCTPLASQDADAAETRRIERLTGEQVAADLPFRLDAGEIHLGDLVDRVAGQLGHNYLPEPKSMGHEQNVFVLQTAVVFDDPEALEVFLGRMLWSRGFVRVPFGKDSKTWEILSVNGPRRQEIAGRARQMSPDEVLKLREHHLPVLCSVPTPHMNSQHATNAMRPFLSQMGSGPLQVVVTSAGPEAPILLQGLAPQVAATIELLRSADADAVEMQSPLQKQVEQLKEQVEELARRLSEPASAAGRASATGGDGGRQQRGD